MLAIQPGRLDGGDEELRSVGVRAGIGHGQIHGSLMLELEVLIGKLLPVNRLAAAAVAVGEVAALDHEVGDDAVETTPLVVKGLPTLASSLLASAERAEVLHGLGDGVAEKSHDNPTLFASLDLDIEENLGGDSLAYRLRLSSLQSRGTSKGQGKQHQANYSQRQHLEVKYAMARTSRGYEAAKGEKGEGREDPLGDKLKFCWKKSKIGRVRNRKFFRGNQTSSMHC